MKKLTEADRAEIIRRSQTGEKQQDLAKAFNVAQSTINRVLNQARKAKRAEVVDPNPAISTETLQKRHWAKYKRLVQVVGNLHEFLQKDRRYLEAQVSTWDKRATRAVTPEDQEAFKHRADSYRLELASLNNISAFHHEMLELYTELQMLAEVLLKVRGPGMGKTPEDWR